MTTATPTTAVPQERAVPQARAKEITPQRRLLGLIGTYALMIFIALLFILPMLWMLSTSLKPKREWFTRTIEWVPKTLTLENYQRIFANPATPIASWFINSLIIAATVTILILVVDSLAGYAYARLEFPGRRLIFGILLATLFLPGIMFLVPNFLTVARLGLLNNFGGVIIPALAGVFGVFFMRQFFESIPKELEEAAEIDGANRFQIFYQIALPLSKPALATLAVITFLGSWNDFLWPLLILKSPDLQTLPVGLATLQGAYTSEYGVMMAGAVIVAIPVLVIYAALQRFIVESVASTGIKG
jgi:multiple sugar transport system permease protein